MDFATYWLMLAAVLAASRQACGQVTVVTSAYRYKRPPRKRRAVALEVPAIVAGKRVAKANEAE